MYKIAICDDERFVIEHTHCLIKEFFDSQKQLNCGYEITCYTDSGKLMNSGEKFDIAFLDVKMEPYSGIELGYALSAKNPEIVLFILTSFGDYLDDAMDLKAFRFFEKPLNKKRLYRALDSVVQNEVIIEFIMDHLHSEICSRDIVCVYSSQRKTHITTCYGKTFSTRHSFDFWEQNLKELPNFCKPHSSYIVNTKFVKRVDGKRICLSCKDGNEVNIYGSQRLFPAFKKAYLRG